MLDATAAAAFADAMANKHEAAMLALGAPYTPGTVAIVKASVRAWYLDVATELFAVLQASAVVSPAGVPPMSNSGGAVAGVGKIL